MIPHYQCFEQNLTFTFRLTFSWNCPDIENKISDATGFITNPAFNRLTKINFDARMKEPEKSLASKSQVYPAIDTVDKNKEKIKKLQVFKLFHWQRVLW